MIKWKPEYAIGVDIIDEQHKKLFDIAEEAYELLNLPSRVDKFDQIVRIAQELKEYVVFHFTEEEKMLREMEYKKFFTHCIHHHDFIIELRAFNLEDIDEGQEEHILQLVQLVNNWLIVHVTNEDIEWAKVYKEKYMQK